MPVRLTKKAPSVATIAVSGRLDAVEAAPLRATLNEYLTTGTNRIVVDLSDVVFVDSAGLAALVIGMKRARQDNGDLRLVTPAHADARRVFELTKFDEVFVMAEDLDAAHEGW